MPSVEYENLYPMYKIFSDNFLCFLNMDEGKKGFPRQRLLVDKKRYLIGSKYTGLYKAVCVPIFPT